MNFIITLIILSAVLFANDSEYQTSGNQLMPIENTDVRLDKEVLKITRGEHSFFNVDVNYTLFNEGKERNITIGFEAPKSVGDREPQGYFGFARNDTLLLKSEQNSIKMTPLKKGHEYIEGFQVVANGKTIPYKIVDSTVLGKDKHSSIYVGYLYYFKMKLKKGINRLHHSYRFNGQGSVHYTYEFVYILETASRWKDGKIGDFTLILDMGKQTQFSTYKTFFKGANNWKTKGIGKKEYFARTPCNAEYCPVGCCDRMAFYIYEGQALYHKKDFIPNSIIDLNAEMGYISIFDSEKNQFWVSHNFALPALAEDRVSLKILKAFPDACQGKRLHDKEVKQYYTSKTDWYKEGKVDTDTWPTVKQHSKRWLNNIEKNKKKILLNLPFARRGYIFKSYNLATFFGHQKWYKANLKYRSKLSDLIPKEQKWRKAIKSKNVIGDEEFFNLIEEHADIYNDAK